jgi:hypothetical protein
VGGWERILTLKERQNHKGMQRPLRILDVSGDYQNYQDGAVSNQLTEAGVERYLYIIIIVSVIETYHPLKWEV